MGVALAPTFEVTDINGHLYNESSKPWKIKTEHF